MAYEFKKLSAVEAVETPADTANVLIEENGVIKKTTMNSVGSVKSVNGVSPDENGNVEMSVASSWNDLTDKPFGGEDLIVYIDEQEITFDEDGYAEVSMNQNCPSGEQCKAIFDGVEYTGKVEWWETDAGFQFTLSDGTIVTITWWNGISAQIYSNKYEDWANTTRTIKFVSLERSSINKIDVKFLPTTFEGESIILKAQYSNKRFKITVDNSGNLTTTEITE